MVERDAWHLDRKVPIALMVTIFMQSATAVWWASSIESRVGTIAKSDDSQNLKLQSVENSVQTMAVGAATLAAQLSALKDAMDEVRANQHETNDLLRQFLGEPKK